LELKIPITVFEDKVKSVESGLAVYKENSELNLNKVNMTRYNKGQVPFASFHSKLILYEFDDRLRVIVSSANLTLNSWNKLSQVIWV
jgi:phosphatidylserine/phosphatidylglycerophosphate/cardiolipin synthase-like enzyme